MYYLYILKSIIDNKYYIGSTDSIERRLEEHNRGQTKSTKFRRPFKLIFTQKYSTLKEARYIEKKLKSFKNKKIIDRIVAEGSIKLKRP